MLENQTHLQAVKTKVATGQLSDANRNELPTQQELRERMDAFLENADASALPATIVEDIDLIIRMMYGEMAPDERRIVSQASYEAVVVADGSRPVFFFQNDQLTPGAGNGAFVDLLYQHQARIEGAAKAVGRIESDRNLRPRWSDKWFAGTAFLISDNYAVTNRHVARRLISGSTTGTGPFRLNGEYWLNLDAQFVSTENGVTHVSGDHRRKIKSIPFAGPDLIGRSLDLGKLDIAVLELESTADPVMFLPVRFRNPEPLDPVSVIGFPGAPKNDGVTSEETFIRLFDKRFGFKRISAGEVDAKVGQVRGDSKGWTFIHDATTLGGNSGSPVLDLNNSDEPLMVLGVHFFGVAAKANYAHHVSALSDILERYGAETQLVL